MAEEVRGRFSTLYSELGGERQGSTMGAEANRQPRENALAFLSRQSTHEETPAQMTESAMAKEAGIATKEASRAEDREMSNRVPERIDRITDLTEANEKSFNLGASSSRR
jgi:hypothetical protein